MRPPKLIKPYVISFARQVVSDCAPPFYIPCVPLHGSQQNECFSLVERQVKLKGGNAVLGWTIWERPKVFIEAEFHAVWRAPDGGFHDLAPRRLPIPRTLFVLDHRRKFNGTQVDNVRKALATDRDVKQYLNLMKESYRLLNEGDLEHQFGRFPATRRML